MGFHREDTILGKTIYIGNRKASPEEVAEFEEAFEHFEAGMREARAQGKDVAAADFLPKDSKFRDLLAMNVGPLEAGAELELVSSVDSLLFETDDDDFIREGFGAWVAAFGKDVPVRLNSIVNKISYGEGGVVVGLTTGERFSGRKVLVTVSTGVLNAGKIAFEPPLPAWKKEAIAKVPMGLEDKVAFLFKKDVFRGEPRNSWVLYDGPGKDDMAFVIKPMGANMAVGFHGGEAAWNYSKGSPEAPIEHAKAVLVEIYGKEILDQIEKVAQTRWGNEPFALGAFSAARPGASKMHAEIFRPIGELVYFAGEATTKPIYNGTFAGAYESAIRASSLILKSLMREDRSRKELRRSHLQAPRGAPGGASRRLAA
jgi:monoamine oxidase